MALSESASSARVFREDAGLLDENRHWLRQRLPVTERISVDFPRAVVSCVYSPHRYMKSFDANIWSAIVPDLERLPANRDTVFCELSQGSDYVCGILFNAHTFLEPTYFRSELEAKFRELADRWMRETVALSSSSEIFENDAYWQIIDLGWPALSLVLHELETGNLKWLRALDEIADDVVLEQADSPRSLATAWLAWGRERRFID